MGGTYVQQSNAPVACVDEGRAEHFTLRRLTAHSLAYIMQVVVQRYIWQLLQYR